jgi:hypothetical protein
MNLAQLRLSVSRELGLDNDATTEQTEIDEAINAGVLRVLEDTHCYALQTVFTGFDGTSLDYTLDSTILEVVDLYFKSAGTNYALARLSVPDLIQRRNSGVSTGSPVSFYAVTGANLIMFHPAPGTGDTLSIYHVPVPTALSASGDDPSSTSLGGVPAVLHRAILYWAYSEAASYDDDQTSAQGQRYRDWYDKEITRYKNIIRKKGGTRLARAVVNDKRRRLKFHDNSVYPS